MFVPLRNFGVLNKFHVDVDLRSLITDNQPRKLTENVKLSISEFQEIHFSKAGNIRNAL